MHKNVNVCISYFTRKHTCFWCLPQPHVFCNRVGVANFITLLVQKAGFDIKPYASMLLKLLFLAVKEERSATAKRAFASACAIVLKYAAQPHAQKLIEDTAALHSGDRNAQISCAVLLKSYSSMASDVVSGYHTEILPVIFVSRFELYTF